MSALLARFSLLVVLLALIEPSTAEAWTRTEVRGMRARAEVMPSGFARVGLEITVEVQGGWVERFEVAGLGQGAQLDALKPPTWIKTSVALDDTDATPGTKYVPTLQLRPDGTLTLDFGPRVTAPRRGTFVSRIVYETRLLNDGRGALVLALPTWPSALENVELWIDAPRGTTLAAGDGELEGTVVLERGALTTVHIVKAQLPRTHSLEAHLALPGVELAEVAAVPAPVHEGEASDPQRAQSWIVAGVLLALIAWKRRLSSAPGPIADQERMFAALKAIAIALPCALFPYAQAWSTAAGAIALASAVALGVCLPLRLNDPERPAGLRYRRAHALDLARVRRARLASWLGPRSWLDATTPSGLAVLGLSGALAILAVQRSSDAGDALWLEAWAIALPLFVVRTRFARRLDAGDALLALGEARGALAEVAEAHGARAVLEVARASTCGPALRARLRFASSYAPEVALVLAEDAHGRGQLAWLVTADGKSTLRAAAQPELELAELLVPSAAVETALDTAA